MAPFGSKIPSTNFKPSYNHTSLLPRKRSLTPWEKQVALAKRLNVPLFIELDRITRVATCPFCRYPIFNNTSAAFNAGKRLITSCPDCHRSFCD